MCDFPYEARLKANFNSHGILNRHNPGHWSRGQVPLESSTMLVMFFLERMFFSFSR